MWEMKNLMRNLVPQEQKVLTKEERLPMSKGLEMILHRHNFDVKPEMVSFYHRLSLVIFFTWHVRCQVLIRALETPIVDQFFLL